MTATVEDKRGTSTPPGWSIHADLLPPEVLSSRRLKVVRRGVVSLLAAFVILLVLLYLLASYRAHQAASGLAQESATQSSLQAEKASYSEVTDLNDQIALVTQQLSHLMVSDVVMSDLLRPIRKALPAGAGLTDVQLSVTPATGLAVAGSPGGSSLDTSGALPIGTVTINGHGPDFLTASAYATALGNLDGVVDVQAQTNNFEEKSFLFTITLTITDERLSHRYDVTAPGS